MRREVRATEAVRLGRRGLLRAILPLVAVVRGVALVQERCGVSGVAPDPRDHWIGKLPVNLERADSEVEEALMRLEGIAPDPLDRITSGISRWTDEYGREWHQQWVVLAREDVLALVEVARAARDYVSRCELCVGEGWYDDYQRSDDGERKVRVQCDECGWARAALARLEDAR